jgi:[acyl-carrier-protein] S-malonyltransferase
MNKKIAFLFPGQGSQYIGMGKDFFQNFTESRELYEQAEDLLHFKLTKILFEGPENKLAETQFSQLAIFVNSCALLQALKKQFPQLAPYVTAGLSLGEYTALYASQKINFTNCLLLVEKRAKLMSLACRENPGSMMAVLGLPGQEVKKIIDSLNPPYKVWSANFNHPEQVVISGNLEGLEKAKVVLKEKGAKKVVPLQVEGAFHSPLMASVQEKLYQEIEQTPLLESAIQIVMNATGSFVHSTEEIRKNLIEQITHGVLWQQGIESIEKENITNYIEIGSGQTLCHFNKKIGVKAPSISIDKIQDLEKLGSL